MNSIIPGGSAIKFLSLERVIMWVPNYSYMLDQYIRELIYSEKNINNIKNAIRRTTNIILINDFPEELQLDITFEPKIDYTKTYQGSLNYWDYILRIDDRLRFATIRLEGNELLYKKHILEGKLSKESKKKLELYRDLYLPMKSNV